MNQRKATESRDNDSLSDIFPDTFLGFKRTNSDLEWNRTLKNRIDRQSTQERTDRTRVKEDKLFSMNFEMERMEKRRSKKGFTDNQEKFYNNLLNKTDNNKTAIEGFEHFNKIEDRLLNLKELENKQEKEDEIIPKEVKKEVKENKRKRIKKAKNVIPRNIGDQEKQKLIVERKKRRETNKERKGSEEIQVLEKINTLFKNLLKRKELKLKELTLTDFEFTVFKSFVKRKFKINLIADIQKNPSQLKKQLLSISRENCKKRPEENYKFVFKRCIKKLKNDYAKSLGKKLKREAMEKSFYKFYFQEISERENMKLEQFYHPKNTPNRNEDVPKTINMEYIKNLTRSELFIERFFKYMKSDFQEDYEEVIDIKINRFFEKWEKLFQENEKEEVILKQILDYIEKNKKCKFPWSNIEVENAIKSVKGLFKEDN